MAISSGYSGIEGSPNVRTRIEAKYPALLFKQHLTACVEKIYGMIRDNLKKEISPFLNQCIHVSKHHFLMNPLSIILQQSQGKF